jgi:heme exporter protein D
MVAGSVVGTNCRLMKTKAIIQYFANYGFYFLHIEKICLICVFILILQAVFPKKAMLQPDTKSIILE